MATLPLPRPGDRLTGITVDGWTIGNPFSRPPAASGGHFSTGYEVTHVDGRQAFLKAIDISDALIAPDPAKSLQQQTELFLFERELLELCKPMSRVVTAIGGGTIAAGSVPGTFPSPVFYLIFEKADGDARIEVVNNGASDPAKALRTLHHVFIGMEQLHTQLIAHLDLKPSNVLYFSGAKSLTISKVADLGRADKGDRKLPELLEGLGIAGDLGYAPPEYLYGEVVSDWHLRRLGCDLYLLGGLITFFFTGLPMTALIKQNLDPAHSWTNWTDSYANVLVYVRGAYQTSLDQVRAALEATFAARKGNATMRQKTISELMGIVQELCDPQPNVRGNPRTKASNPFSLQKYVSAFDVLAKRAEAGFV